MAALMARPGVRPSTQMICNRNVIKHAAAQQQRRRPAACTRLRAYLREYPDPEFIQEVLERFPEDGIANAEEARVLFSEAGYKYVDVRPAFEFDDAGHCKQAINVPVMHLERKWSSEEQKKVSKKSPNDNFVEDFKRKFPDLETPILIACSDGRTYSIDALEQLDDAGYVNLVGLKGGFYAWYKVWDNNLRRRRTGEYAENYQHGADSCGIHASGAGFDRVDAIEQWGPKVY